VQNLESSFSFSVSAAGTWTTTHFFTHPMEVARIRSHHPSCRSTILPIATEICATSRRRAAPNRTTHSQIRHATGLCWTIPKATHLATDARGTTFSSWLFIRAKHQTAARKLAALTNTKYVKRVPIASSEVCYFLYLQNMLFIFGGW